MLAIQAIRVTGRLFRYKFFYEFIEKPPRLRRFFYAPFYVVGVLCGGVVSPVWRAAPRTGRGSGATPLKAFGLGKNSERLYIYAALRLREGVDLITFCLEMSPISIFLGFKASGSSRRSVKVNKP